MMRCAQRSSVRGVLAMAAFAVACSFAIGVPQAHACGPHSAQSCVSIAPDVADCPLRVHAADDVAAGQLSENADEADESPVFSAELYSDGLLLIRVVPLNGGDQGGTATPDSGSSSDADASGAKGANPSTSNDVEKASAGEGTASASATGGASAGGGNAADSGAIGDDGGEGSEAGDNGGMGLLPGLGSDEPSVLQTYTRVDGHFGCANDVPWYAQRGAIRRVSFEGEVRPCTMAFWFAGLDRLASIDFDGLDTSAAQSMESLFDGCGSVASLDASSLDTRRVSSMTRMFAGCSGLVSLDVSTFDTSNVTDMSGMFAGCSGLASLDLSNFNTECLQETGGMFEGCSSLAALDVSGFTASQLGAAAIPVENSGGFWKMNVPAGYDAGVKLREPSAAERAAAGISDGGSANDEQDDTRSSGGKGESSQANTSSSGSSAQSSTSTTSAASVAFAAASAMADAQSSAVSATSAISAISSVDETSAIEAAGVSETPSVFTIGALVINALSKSATGIVEPIAQLALDPALDIADVSGATADILDALGIGAAVDKTMAMVAAAIGMLIAAGLVLTLCMKIR